MPKKFSKREVLLNADDVRWFYKNCPGQSLSEVMRQLLFAYRKQLIYNPPIESIQDAAREVHIIRRNTE